MVKGTDSNREMVLSDFVFIFSPNFVSDPYEFTVRRDAVNCNLDFLNCVNISQ